MRAFAALSEPLTSHTGDRREFLGRNGYLECPAALTEEGPLSGTTSAVRDPCAALQCVLMLEPGETRELVVVLGAAADEAQAKAWVAQYKDVGRAKHALSEATEAWKRRLSVVTVRTPEPSFDA